MAEVHFSGSPDSVRGPICGSSDRGTVNIGSSFTAAEQVDCADCWGILATIFVQMQHMGVKMREKNMEG